MSQSKPLRSIELFAGCGGLALGLHRAGWSGLFAVERDPMAFETLASNLLDEGAPYKAFGGWPEWLPKEPTDLLSMLDSSEMRANLSKLRGQVDLIAGGPPCQGFSVGGKRDGTDDRNSLVYKMLEFVDLIQPRAVLIENVEGMARRFLSKPGKAGSSVAEDVIAKLEDSGYIASFHILDATRFGVPQARRRVAIIGVLSAGMTRQDFHDLSERKLSDAAQHIRSKYGLPADGDVTVSQAISDLDGNKVIECPDSPGFLAGTYGPARSAYAKLMREGVKRGQQPDSHRFSKHGDRVRNLYQLAHETQPPGRLSKAFLLENGTKKDKKVLLDRKAVVTTITTHPDEYIHYAHPRNVTVREMARLQSFPDNFHFRGRYTINGPRRRFDVARCSQVGNAVPPLMGEGLALAIQGVLAEISSSKSNPKLVTREKVAA